MPFYPFVDSALRIPILAFASDLPNYLSGALIVKEGKGDRLYDIETQISYENEIIKPFTLDPFLPFRSPPFVALVFIFFTLFPFRISYILLTIFSLFILATLALLSGESFKNLSRHKLWFLIPFSFLPSATAIIYGQLSNLLVLIILLVYKLFKSRMSFMAGAVFALLFIKPHFFW